MVPDTFSAPTNRVGWELVSGAGLAKLAQVGKIGKAALALDVGGNLAGAGRGGHDILQKGPTWQNVTELVAGLAGLGGNVAGLRKGAGALDAPSNVRPSWRQSELDVGTKLEGQGYRPQTSFKNGQEVPYGTKGSSRPEYYKPGSSVEVKNYNVETASGRSSLVRNVTDQAKQRVGNLPPGTRQKLEIDVRGQNVSRETLNELTTDIMNKSGGAIKREDITFIR